MNPQDATLWARFAAQCIALDLSCPGCSQNNPHTHTYICWADEDATGHLAIAIPNETGHLALSAPADSQPRSRLRLMPKIRHPQTAAAQNMEPLPRPFQLPLPYAFPCWLNFCSRRGALSFRILQWQDLPASPKCAGPFSDVFLHVRPCALKDVKNVCASSSPEDLQASLLAQETSRRPGLQERSAFQGSHRSPPDPGEVGWMSGSAPSGRKAQDARHCGKPLASCGS